MIIIAYDTIKYHPLNQIEMLEEYDSYWYDNGFFHLYRPGCDEPSISINSCIVLTIWTEGEVDREKDDGMYNYWYAAFLAGYPGIN